MENNNIGNTSNFFQFSNLFFVYFCCCCCCCHLSGKGERGGGEVRMCKINDPLPQFHFFYFLNNNENAEKCLLQS